MDALQHSVIIAQGWSFRVGGLDESPSGADRFGIVAVSIAWATRPCESTELNCCGHRPPLQAEMKKPLALRRPQGQGPRVLMGFGMLAIRRVQAPTSARQPHSSSL